MCRARMLSSRMLSLSAAVSFVLLLCGSFTFGVDAAQHQFRLTRHARQARQALSRTLQPPGGSSSAKNSSSPPNARPLMYLGGGYTLAALLLQNHASCDQTEKEHGGSSSRPGSNRVLRTRSGLMMPIPPPWVDGPPRTVAASTSDGDEVLDAATRSFSDCSVLAFSSSMAAQGCNRSSEQKSPSARFTSSSVQCAGAAPSTSTDCASTSQTGCGRGRQPTGNSPRAPRPRLTMRESLREAVTSLCNEADLKHEEIVRLTIFAEQERLRKLFDGSADYYVDRAAGRSYLEGLTFPTSTFAATQLRDGSFMHYVNVDGGQDGGADEKKTPVVVARGEFLARNVFVNHGDGRTGGNYMPVSPVHAVRVTDRSHRVFTSVLEEEQDPKSEPIPLLLAPWGGLQRVRLGDYVVMPIAPQATLFSTGTALSAAGAARGMTDEERLPGVFVMRAADFERTYKFDVELSRRMEDEEVE